MFDLINSLTNKEDKTRIVWLCNIGAEKYWNKLNIGISDKQEDIVVSHIEEMNLLLCRSQDIIILREYPDEEFLRTLNKLGFQIPRILIPKGSDEAKSISELILDDKNIINTLKDISNECKETYFVPYAVTSFEEKIADLCNLKLVGAPSNINAKINNKIFNKAIAEQLNFNVCIGKTCKSIDEIREEYYNLTEKNYNFKKVIIKEPCGASGKGLYIIDDKSKLEGNLRLISRLARNIENPQWIVEGWYNKKTDINYQIYVSEDGNVNVFSIKEQILKDTIYIGSRIKCNISPEKIEEYKKCGEDIGKYLYNFGFTGVAGVDSFITEEDEIIPIIEINGRFTLSTYLSFLEEKFSESIITTRYFKVTTNNQYDYTKLKELLYQNDLLYDDNKKEGVIIYTSKTLPVHFIEKQNNYLGRIFALILGKDDTVLDQYIDRLENLIKELD